MNRSLHLFAVFVSVMTFLLLCAGALVTGTGSGLAVPDWPLSFGTLFPPMVGGVLYEHGHRLIAGTVAILTFVLCLLLLRFEERRWVRVLGVCALVIILCQALLGGLTVLFRLPRSVSISHACLAQIFFSITVLIAAAMGNSWRSNHFIRSITETSSTSLRSFALLTSIMLFVQLIFGATMRHNGAGLAIPDFPTAFGGLIPPQFDFKIAIHFCHRMGALTVVLLTAYLASRVLRKHPEQLEITLWVGLLSAAVAFQVMLGATVIWLRRPIPITTAHLAVGALCLAFSVTLTVQVFRRPILRVNKEFSEGTNAILA